MTSLRRFLHVPAALLALALHAPGAAAVPAHSATVAGAQATELGAVIPRFSLFGWVSPPLAYTAEARYAEMAKAGFNVTVLAWDDSGCVADNRDRLNATRPVGMRNLLLDNRLDSVFTARPSTLALADTIVADYANDPAFMGYYLGDEPKVDSFDRLGEWFGVLRQRDPAHPAWNSLAGRMGFGTHADFENYTRTYVTATSPAILCNSQYEFHTDYDAHQMTENVSTIAQISRERGIPFWGVVLVVQHFVFRHVTDGLLRWQVAQWMAYGARGIGYFTYWTPAPDAYYDWQPAMVTYDTGARTATFDTVSALNARLAPIGNTLASATWLATEYSGGYVPDYGAPYRPNGVVSAVTGRATLGFFADSTNSPLVFVANRDSLQRQTVSLMPASRRRVWRLRNDGSAWDDWTPPPGMPLSLSLAAGDFALLRLSGPVGTIASTPDDPRTGALRLDAWPNPARGAVRFALGGVRDAARLEVLDVSGRRVWSRACVAGASDLAWNGDDERGGRAAAGVYVARLSSAGRVVTRRVAWLGAR